MRNPEDLVHGASEGKSTDIEELLQKYLPTARAIVRRRMSAAMRTREESLDLVQSVCKQVLEKRDRYSHGSDEEFRAWLLKVVENKILDHYRFHHQEKRDQRRVAHPGDASAADPIERLADSLAGSPSGIVAKGETVENVRRALEAMPHDLREALRLHHFAGLSYEEVARKLDCTPKQARLRVFKAKLGMAERLTAHGESSTG